MFKESSIIIYKYYFFYLKLIYIKGFEGIENMDF